MTDRELMQQALDALEWNLPVIEDYGDHEQLNRQHRAITALRSRLAQPVQEPVAWLSDDGNVLFGPGPKGKYTRPLYTTPQPRQWQGLTDEEIEDIHCTPPRARPRGKFPFARTIEAKLKEKNT